jgi:hypothetical protein
MTLAAIFSRVKRDSVVAGALPSSFDRSPEVFAAIILFPYSPLGVGFLGTRDDTRLHHFMRMKFTTECPGVIATYAQRTSGWPPHRGQATSRECRPEGKWKLQ